MQSSSIGYRFVECSTVWLIAHVPSIQERTPSVLESLWYVIQKIHLQDYSSVDIFCKH